MLGITRSTVMDYSRQDMSIFQCFLQGITPCVSEVITEGSRQQEDRQRDSETEWINIWEKGY